MNKDIDWSEAPEVATHYDNEYRYFCNKDGWWDNAGGFVDDPNQTRWGTDRYTPRPQAWKEWDLPPVGSMAVIDLSYVNLSGTPQEKWKDGDQVEILAHKEGPFGPVVVVWNIKLKETTSVIGSLLRPLKSEKERLIESISGRLRDWMDSTQTVEDFAGGLYEAGCRLPDADQD
jgi:hypothetical protein